MKTNLETLESDQLTALGERFLKALAAQDKGQMDDAEDELRRVIRTEPRLAEPHLALGRLLLDSDRLGDAEEHTRQFLQTIETTGPWTEDLTEVQLRSLGHAQLAEVLRRKADEDDVIFGDPDVFHGLVKESQSHFAKAAELDPSDETSSYWSFFMGDDNTSSPV